MDLIIVLFFTVDLADHFVNTRPHPNASYRLLRLPGS